MNLQLNRRGRLHETCAHRRYVLTCEQYDELLVRSGNQCEICRAHAATQQWGKLCVDHDHQYGLWAVRGMLCHGCNRFLDQLPRTHPAVADYLRNAWHLSKGWRLDVPQEPSLGARVMEPRRKVWGRVDEGWLRLNPHNHREPSVMVIPWREVIHRFGSHNLRVLLPDAPSIEWGSLR